ncbi:MAG: hypothetical protein ISS16_07055 [Ignavibacteria bacterium]|nr:hypothetical protein [Ignavibacteria bacterium]
MKKIIFLLFATIVISQPLLSQEDDETISFDLLRAPSSPGFTILGINPTEVDRPSSPMDFLASIQNASDNFSVYPKSYSVEMNPAWLFFSDKMKKWSDFKSNKLRENILQGLTVSLATTTNESQDSIEVTNLGVGVKISIFRGEIDTNFKGYKNDIDSIREDVKKINKIISSSINTVYKEDSILIKLRQEAFTTPDLTELAKKIEDRQKYLLDSLDSLKREFKDSLYKKDELAKNVKKTVSNLKYQRIGFKLDVAGGLALNFPFDNFDSLKVFKWGAWLNAGYEWHSGWSVFLLGRYLRNIDRSIIDDSNNVLIKSFGNLDVGGSIYFDNLFGFTISGEIIYRHYQDVNNVKAKYKASLNVSYELAKNKLLTFTFGRDFEGNTETGGNVIAALNLALGFGSMRPF